MSDINEMRTELELLEIRLAKLILDAVNAYGEKHDIKIGRIELIDHIHTAYAAKGLSVHVETNHRMPFEERKCDLIEDWEKHFKASVSNEYI